MSLGTRSRKTGFKLNKAVEKDEHSMENIDAYFKEDENEPNSPKSSSYRKQTRSSKIMDSDKSTLSIQSPSQANITNNSQILDRTTFSKNDNISFVNRSHTVVDSTKMFDHEVSNDYSTPIKPYSRSYGSVSDTSHFNTDYNIPDTIEEVSEEEHYDKKYRGGIETDRIGDTNQQCIPDLLEDSEVDVTYSDGSSLLNTSEDALLEYEIEAKYTQANGVDNSVSDDYDYRSINNGDDDYLPRQSEPHSHSHPVPLRRSSRIKIPTLDYWRNEKIVYKRNSKEPSLNIAKVITFNDDTDDKSSDEYKRRCGKRSSSNEITTKKNKRLNIKKKSNESYCSNKRLKPKLISKEKIKHSSWLVNGTFEGTINTQSINENRNNISHINKERLAIAPGFFEKEKVIDDKTEDNIEKYKIGVLFDSQKERFASGMLTLPINGQKGKSIVGDIYITFYVVKGTVEVTISTHKQKDKQGTVNKFTCIKGTTFQVPSYNSYSLVNKGNDEVELYFVQVTMC